MRIVSVVIVAVLGFLSAPAAADIAKVWTVAKDNLPANTRAIGAVDVAVAVKSPVYTALFNALMKEEKDFAMGYEMLKKTCKFDPAQVIEGLVAAGDPDGDSGVIMLQLSIDRKASTACLESMMKAVGEKVTVKQDGIYTTVKMGGDTVYFAWPSPNVVAISVDPDKKASYDRWLGGKGALAKTTLAERIGKLDTKAIAWGACQFEKPLDDNDLPILSATGTVTIAKGSATGKLRASFKDAAAATKSVGMMKKELEGEMKRQKTPEALRKVLKSIKIATDGKDGTLEGTIVEADIAAAINAMVSK